MFALIGVSAPIIAQAEPAVIGEIQGGRIDVGAEIVEGGCEQMLDDRHQDVGDVGTNEHFFLESGTVRVAGATLLVCFLDLALDVGEDLFKKFDAEGAALDDVLETLEGLEVGVIRLCLRALVGGAAEAAESAAVVFQEGAGGGNHDEEKGGGVEVVYLVVVQLQAQGQRQKDAPFCSTKSLSPQRPLTVSARV